jgi:hypothetical protein
LVYDVFEISGGLTGIGASGGIRIVPPYGLHSGLRQSGVPLSTAGLMVGLKAGPTSEARAKGEYGACEVELMSLSSVVGESKPKTWFT